MGGTWGETGGSPHAHFPRKGFGGPLSRPPNPVTSLDFVEALPGRAFYYGSAGASRESPTLARRFPVKVPGTRLYELVPPLPVLEISIYRTTSFPR